MSKKFFTDYLALLFLSAIWGSSFLFIKLSVDTIPPSLMTFFRLFIASLILIFYLKFFSNQKIFIFDNSFKLIFIALFGNLIPFNLISWSELYVDSVIASTLIGSMPLFTCIISHFSKSGEKIKFITFLGLLIGFAGILFLMNPGFNQIFSTRNFYSLIILFSALCYALSANCVKEISEMTSIQVATISTIYATFFSFITTVSIFQVQKISLLETITNISVTSMIACLMLSIFCTAIAIIIFFYLIKKNSAVFASQSNFFIPCFGFFWSFIFLNENIDVKLVFSLIFIVIGLYFVHKGRKYN